MKSIWLRFAQVLSTVLDPAEREAVFGDFAELGLTDRRALKGVLGLVVRRQFGFWKEWQPWFVLAAIVVPIGPLLADSSDDLVQSMLPSLLMWFHHGIYYETGISLPAFLAALGLQATAIVTWSWTSAFALGALSRRTAWANGFLFLVLCVVFGNLPRLFVYAIPIFVNFLLVLLPAYFGIRQSAKSEGIAHRWMLCMAIWTVAIGGFAFWTQGWSGTVLDNWGRGAPALGLFQLMQRAPVWEGLGSHLFMFALLTGPIVYLLAIIVGSHRLKHFS